MYTNDVLMYTSYYFTQCIFLTIAISNFDLVTIK